MPVVIFERAKAATAHAVDIQGSSQVVDLVLQDARIPTSRVDPNGFSQVV
jgi:hypothetical protein